MPGEEAKKEEKKAPYSLMSLTFIIGRWAR